MSDVLILTLFSLLPTDADNNALEESEDTKWKKFCIPELLHERELPVDKKHKKYFGLLHEWGINLGSVSVIAHLECICYSS